MQVSSNSIEQFVPKLVVADFNHTTIVWAVTRLSFYLRVILRSVHNRVLCLSRLKIINPSLNAMIVVMITDRILTQNITLECCLTLNFKTSIFHASSKTNFIKCINIVAHFYFIMAHLQLIFSWNSHTSPICLIIIPAVLVVAKPFCVLD